MASIRVPSFLMKLDKKEKAERMKEYLLWKKQYCTEYLVMHLEDELDQLVKEDEENSFSSWFETKWNKARRLGRRAKLRQVLKDLK